MNIPKITLITACCAKGYNAIHLLRNKLKLEGIVTSFEQVKFNSEVEVKYNIPKQEVKKNPIILVNDTIFRLSEISEVEKHIKQDRQQITQQVIQQPIIVKGE